MNRLESLKEAARLLALYLHVAEYLSAQRADAPIANVLPHCYGAFSMSADDDLLTARVKLGDAYDVLSHLTDLPSLRESRVLSGGGKNDCTAPLIDGCGRIRSLLAGEVEALPPQNFQVARWYTELAGALLTLKFPSEQETGQIQSYEMALIPNLMAAVTFSSDSKQTLQNRRPAEYRQALAQLANILPALRRKAEEQPDPLMYVFRVIDATHAALSERIC